MPIPIPNPEEYVNMCMKKLYYHVPPDSFYDEAMKHDIDPLTAPEHKHMGNVEEDTQASKTKE